MARKPRIVVPGGTYHVFARGNNRQEIVSDDEDFRVLELLTLRTIRRYGWTCWIYTLMPNHLHLVVEAHEPNLSRGMQYLLGRWAQLFNERWCRVGHLWQGRFADRVLESEEARERACNYVMANPVAAKLAATPEAWPYTGGVLATWRSRPRARRAT